MNSARVFFCWQSDSEPKHNHYLIQGALEDAAASLKARGIEVVIDSDTKGVAGAVEIPAVILEKIRTADIVVVDLTTIGTAGERPVPNPNVTFEFGYALAALGQERLVIVLNEANGSPEHLPFDLRHRRVLKYSSGDGSDIKAVRKKLATALAQILEDTLAAVGTSAKQQPPLASHAAHVELAHTEVLQLGCGCLSYAARPSTPPPVALGKLHEVFRKVADGFSNYPQVFEHTSANGGHWTIKADGDGIFGKTRYDPNLLYESWRLGVDGSFVCSEAFGSADSFDMHSTLHEIARAIVFTSALYRELGCKDDVVVELEFEFWGLAKKHVGGDISGTAVGGMLRRFPKTASSNVHKATLRASIADLEQRGEEHLRQIASDFFRLFDFFELPPQHAAKMISDAVKHARS